MNYKILREIVDEIYNEIEISLKKSKNEIEKYYRNYDKSSNDFFSIDITPKWKYTEFNRYFKIIDQVPVRRFFRKYYKYKITLSKEMEESLKSIEFKIQGNNIIEADFYLNYWLEKRNFSFPHYHRLLSTYTIKHPHSKTLSSKDIDFKITVTCVIRQYI